MKVRGLGGFRAVAFKLLLSSWAFDLRRLLVGTRAQGSVEGFRFFFFFLGGGGLRVQGLRSRS